MPFTTKKTTPADKRSRSIIKKVEATRAARIEERKVFHEDPDAKTKTQRSRLEKSLTAWMKFHGGPAFEQPFSPDHKRVIERIEQAINHGGLFALAMPRGHGKSTLLKWATLYCLLTGRRKYVVIIAATAEMAQSIIEFCRQQIQESENLHKHYPHVTTYARATDGKAIKAKFQLRADGKTSGIQWSKTTLVLPDVQNEKNQEYPSNGAILEGHGLTGAIRGKWKDTKTGRVLRPDFVLIDDPQTRESAESESQCNMRERIITGDVLGLAGPRKKIAAVMPCTIVRRDDLADRFLDHKRHPEWSGITTRLVEKWPDSQDTMWKEYAGLYRDGIASGEGTRAAFDFYRLNRKAMDAGAIVSWEERIREKEISALQTAQNLLIEMGDQFWAEYQNHPLKQGVTIYNLTPNAVLARVEKRQAGIVPDWAKTVLAASDVNPSYAITTAVAAFGEDQRCAVLWYGTQEMDCDKKTMSDTQIKAAVHAALSIVGRSLSGLSCRPHQWTIDGGGAPQNTAIDFCANSLQICGIPSVTSFGRASTMYRKTGGQGRKVITREESHLVRERHDRQWIIWNAHYWMEQAQRGWLADFGAPGSCTLPDGHHKEFAEQICREQLKAKGEIGAKMVYDWAHLPGPHDYADCMAMLYMLAACHAQIGTGGYSMQAKPKKIANVVIRR